MTTQHISNPTIYDVTLREGLQTPGGVGANAQERIYAAHLISNYADWIELGMPANDVDEKHIRAISTALADEPIGIGVLARTKNEDIDKSWDTMRMHPKSLCHIFIGTSEQHRAHRFSGRKEKQMYCNDIESSIRRASTHPFTRVMFSPEDAMRTYSQDSGFFFDVLDSARKGYGEFRDTKLICNLPDTTGIATTSEFIEMLLAVKARYGNTIDVSVHSHNDSGHSLSHAMESATQGLATWMQTCFGGIGERNGITPTESLLAQFDERGIRQLTDVQRKNLVPTTNAVLAALGRHIAAEATIAGSYTNISTAGIHTDISGKEAETYHVRASKYGALPVNEFGPTSGANQIVTALAKVRVAVTKEEVNAFATYLKNKSNTMKAPLSDIQIVSEYLQACRGIEQQFRVDKYSMNMSMTGTDFTMTGTIADKPFYTTKRQSGDYRLVIDALREVALEAGYRLEFVDFSARLVPKIADCVLQTRDVPHTLDLDSSIAATTIFSSPRLPLQGRATVVSGHAMHAIIESAIAAAQSTIHVASYLRA